MILAPLIIADEMSNCICLLLIRLYHLTSLKGEEWKIKRTGKEKNENC
jgi:hypothetical protein